jgi:hypothetical protein
VQRPHRGAETGSIIGRELQGHFEPLRGIAVRLRNSALEFLNAVLAQARALGKRLLRQAELAPELPQEVTERPRGCEWRAHVVVSPT